MSGPGPMSDLSALIELAEDAADDGVAAVLCTVVRLEGSGYGRPGARLLLTQDGRRAGFVSGGCLERELARLAFPATRAASATLTFDTRGNPLSPGGRYNAGCEGCVHILCERFAGPTHVGLPRLTADAPPRRTAVVYASDDPDFPVGLRGVFGDARVPADWFGNTDCTHSRAVRTGGGEVRLFVERLDPPQPLLIFGGGDDVRPLASMAATAGRAVTVIARQPDLLTPARFPAATRLVGDPADVAASLPIGPSTACVMMTHSFGDDVRLLPVLLGSPAGYVGLLGPKRRAARLLTHLHEAGTPVPTDRLDTLRSPVGLDIGAATPAEIAVAVLAEVIAVARGRGGQPLRERGGPINDRLDHVEDPVASRTAAPPASPRHWSAVETAP